VSISARWFLDLADRALKGLNEQTRVPLDLFLLGAGDLPDWDVSFIQLAHHLEPDQLTPQVLIRCCPYARPDSFDEKMTETVRRGWLWKKDDGFLLTFRGREVAQGISELSDRLFAKIESLPPPEMKRLLARLDKVVAKIKLLPAPTEKFAFALSLRFERDASAPLLARIRRRTIDLLAFYDDAQLAARQPHEVSGLLWETFTYIWRGDANTAPDLATQLSYRNYVEEDYAAALNELALRGWIVPMDAAHYAVQQQAAQMRQQVEKMTDRLFEAAFVDLSTAETAEFKQLMTDFCRRVGA
jgi:hypothetical protein